jgi:hypothetical protein
MANKTISYTTAGNHWRWVGNYYEEVQVGQLVTMPERGKITAVKFKVAGLGPYSDPTYHDQQDTTKVAGCVWAAGNGDIITKSATQVLAPEAGGAQTWKTFTLPNVWVDAGAALIVGFWRVKTTTQYATQWDYNDTAGASQEMVVQSIAGQVPAGPLPFSISEHRPGQSINYELDYISGGHPKVWHGTSWVEGTARVWDGANWTEAVVKRHNGTSWVESS